jgi:2-polyprenyl-6-methoxyphenol hydroxylase-like FAD-dependent oxidoreductase
MSAPTTTNATNGTSPAQPAAAPTGIRVVIVGAGFAGLTTAIECYRQGHTPMVLEKFPALKPLGDIISFAPNSSRIFQRWPGVAARLDPISLRADGMTIKSWRGETLYHQRWSDEEDAWGIRFDGHRGEYHEIVFRHAVEECGIEIRLDACVEDYFEDETGAGVVLAGGERVVGDVVLAAEGVRSRGRFTVLGYEDAPKPSGYAGKYNKYSIISCSESHSILPLWQCLGSSQIQPSEIRYVKSHPVK